VPILARRPLQVALALVVGAAFVLSAAVIALSPTSARAESKPYIVVIDAGHQKKANLHLEPIGPGSSKKKPKVTAGTRGVATKKREATINLQVAIKLRDELEKRGVKVVMVRTKADVNIANSERAKIANRAGADLLIRVHCDGSPKKSTHGLLVLVPGKNCWTGPILASSLRAGKDIQAATLKTTKASNRGVSKRTDMTGFNWSKVPCVVVEMGVMTNAAEDRRLASSSYQKKLVTGMADGAMRFLKR